MSKQDLFENYPPEKIEALFEAWEQRDFEDIPSDIFFAALTEPEGERPLQQIDMEGKIVGGKLILIPPQNIPLPFTVHDNEIIMGNYTIRLHLRNAANAAPA